MRVISQAVMVESKGRYFMVSISDQGISITDRGVLVPFPAELAELVDAFIEIETEPEKNEEYYLDKYIDQKIDEKREK